VIVDIIESLKQRGPVTEFRSGPESNAEPQVVERVVERLPDNYEKPKDYGPLLQDFDKRIDSMERKLRQMEGNSDRGK
jgi:hypothetical protein